METSPLHCRSQHRLQVPHGKIQIQTTAWCSSVFPHCCSGVFSANLGSWSSSCYISSFTLEFVSQASVCSCLSFGGHRPLLLSCRRTQVSVPHGDNCISGRCSGLVMRERSKFASLITRWVGMDGKQLSSPLSRTKQSIPVEKKGINHFSGNMWTSLIPALPWELCTAPCSGSLWL